MSANKIGVAVIGCGRIAGHHCNSILQANGMEMLAVCDLDKEKAETWGIKYSIPSYTDYRKMIDENPPVQIVAIITPSGMHYEHGIEVLKDFGKHIIMEKPTFMRPEQLVSIYETADQLGLKIFPVFQNRYNKAVQRVKTALDSGELGEIRVVSVRTRWCRPQRYYDLAPWRGTFSHDGGALTNQGIHHVDLLRYLGGPVDRVSAVMRTLGVEIEAEDTVTGTFTYKAGAVGNLEVTMAARPDDFEASFSIVGSKGLAQIGGIAVNELQIFSPDPSTCVTYSEDFSDCVYGNGHAKMYQDIVAHFQDGSPYPVLKEDALSTIKLLHAFYRSDEAEGAFVKVDSNEPSTRLGRPNEKISDLYRTKNQ
jgi:UDP-N-acetyl-2-amino-2-deoxyglucuronate dehydrogenase